LGESSLSREEEYYLPICPLCGVSKALTVQLKPLTPASCVLSIDGGGSRGIIPLENLEILQDNLGPELPLSDPYDRFDGRMQLWWFDRSIKVHASDGRPVLQSTFAGTGEKRS